MASDDQFTAIGQAPVGFQTNSASISRGAEIEGNDKGAIFTCKSIRADGVAVTANANAAPAVWAKSDLNDAIQAQTFAAGKCGINAFGQPGVFGVGRGDRGGVFRSDAGTFDDPLPQTAQISLDPNLAVGAGTRTAFSPLALQPKEGAKLPFAGRIGDLLAINLNAQDVCLFLCVKPSAENKIAAVWKEVLLGPPIDGVR